MRDIGALLRSGIARPLPSGRDDSPDPRIRVDLAHLRGLEGKAKALRFLPRQPARSVLNGRHASRLRGRGLNFEELRSYVPGDDVRAIDWKVTARTGEPHVRVYTEERDRPSLLLVDQRAAMFFGSRLNMKSVTAAEAAALAAFRILDQGDRIGGVVFGDTVVAEIRPKRSRRALDRLIASLAEAGTLLRADAPPVDPLPLTSVFGAASSMARRDHLVIVISDFDGLDDRASTLLGGLAQHNDLILVPVSDPMAEEMPTTRLVVSDGILQAEIDTASGNVRNALTELTTGRLARVLELGRRLGAPVLPLSAGEKTLPQLRRLMGLG